MQMRHGDGSKRIQSRPIKLAEHIHGRKKAIYMVMTYSTEFNLELQIIVSTYGFYKKKGSEKDFLKEASHKNHLIRASNDNAR